MGPVLTRVKELILGIVCLTNVDWSYSYPML